MIRPRVEERAKAEEREQFGVRMQESGIRMRISAIPVWPCRAVHLSETGLVVANRGAGFVYFYGYKTPGRISGLSACGLGR
jgi:hypothetical protein